MSKFSSCDFLQVVFAPGQSIESNLKNLAERRTDIFGVGDEAASEAMIGQKMGEEEVIEKIINTSFIIINANEGSRA